jgi:hypothetical protein
MTDRPELFSMNISNQAAAKRADAQVRWRYSAAELLKGAEHVAELNRKTRWSREGRPVGREIV